MGLVFFAISGRDYGEVVSLFLSFGSGVTRLSGAVSSYCAFLGRKEILLYM